MTDQSAASSATTTAGSEAGFLRTFVDWRRWQFWLLVIFLAWTLGGFFLAPWLIEKVARDTLAENGRSLVLERVAVNPWLLRLRLEGLEVRDEDDTPLVSLGEFFADLQASSLFRWAWTFKELRLDSLRVQDERFEGLDTRLARLAADLSGPPPDPPVAPEPPPRLILQRAELSNGELRIIDRQAGDFEATFGPVSVVLEDLRTLPDHSGRQQVEIRTSEGGVIRWRGDLSIVPMRSQGQVTLEGQSLADLFDYSEYFLPFSVTGDGVELGFSYRFAMNAPAAGETEGSPAEIEFILEQLQGRWNGTRLTADGESVPTLEIAGAALDGGYFRWPGPAGDPETGLASLAFEGLSLRAGRNQDGGIDLLRLIPEDGADNPGTAPADTGSPGDGALGPLRIAIGEVSLRNGRIELQDRTQGPPVDLVLDGIQARLSGIDNQPGTAMPMEASLNLSSGGEVGFQGTVTALPAPVLDGKLELRGVELNVAQPYLDDIARVELSSGRLELTAELHHDPEQLLAMNGGLSVTGFLVQDTRREERLAGWQSLRLDRFEADLAGQRVATSTVRLEEPYGRLHIAEDRSTNLDGLLLENSGGEATTAEPLSVVVGGLDFADGALDFSDFSLPLPFEAAIRSLDGEISALATDSSEPARVDLEGQVNEFGLATIGGELDAWSPTDLLDIAMVFRNLEMPRLSPYTVQFAGYEVADGRMDLDLQYRIEKQQLQGGNQIVVRDMQLGDKVEHPDAGSLPLGLAIALLKDSEGVIDIEVPVEGDLNDPEFRIGGVIWRALGNLISKVVTAPFRLLGNLVGVESEDFGRMEFAAGRADLSPPDREDLVKLGEAMLARPELALTVAGPAAPAIDRPVLQEQRLEQLLDERLAGQDPGEVTLDAERKVLEALWTEQQAGTPPDTSLEALRSQHTSAPAEGADADPVFDETAYLAELRSRLAAAQPVPDEELRTLAQARATAVSSALLEAQPELAGRIVTESPAFIEADEAGDYVPLELGVSIDD